MALQGTMVRLDGATVTNAGGQSAIEFNNISQLYSDLMIVASIRSSASAISSNLFVQFNSASTGHSDRYVGGAGSGTPFSGVVLTNNNRLFLGDTNANTSTTSVFGSHSVYITNYTSASNAKGISIDSVSENNATTAYAELIAGTFTGGAITSMRFTVGDGTPLFMQNSTITLYGISRVAPGAKATGGMLYETDTHFYHLFNSSGVFTPLQDLTVDYLVVAGGGGGAGYFEGGGGGAGGLRSTVTATGGGGSLESALSLTANTGYTVTVGAGGSGGSGGNNGSVGSNSVFSTITSSGGGYGGNAGASQNGGSGGSGGGTGRSLTEGSGTANQGYKGGKGDGGTASVGGGGGAGQAGFDASGSVGGNGGNGVQVSITGTSTYYAGGGGGSSSGTNGSGGLGGGGAAASGTATSGTANTGGGGGGSRQTGSGGAGGSGVVIVRYSK